MGTGWEYFNNVCKALRVAVSVLYSTMGIVIVTVVGWAIYQHFQTEEPLVTQAADGTAAPAADAGAKPNPQFKAPQPTAAPGTNGAAGSAESPADAKPNAQFKQGPPNAATAPGKVSHPDFYNQFQKPNPQFH